MLRCHANTAAEKWLLQPHCAWSFVCSSTMASEGFLFYSNPKAAVLIVLRGYRSSTVDKWVAHTVKGPVQGVFPLFNVCWDNGMDACKRCRDVNNAGTTELYNVAICGYNSNQTHSSRAEIKNLMELSHQMKQKWFSVHFQPGFLFPLFYRCAILSCLWNQKMSTRQNKTEPSVRLSTGLRGNLASNSRLKQSFRLSASQGLIIRLSFFLFVFFLLLQSSPGLRHLRLKKIRDEWIPMMKEQTLVNVRIHISDETVFNPK